MTRPKAAPSITNIIGVLLVVVALVSAGGLYYLASEYTKISETLVSAEPQITSVRFSLNNATGEVTFTLTVTLDNPSDLDIQIYRIEYMSYVDRVTSSITRLDRYVGSGSTNDGNGTIPGGSLREIQISHVISPDTMYRERLTYALEEGSDFWTYVNGFVWFRISNYPEVTNRLPLFYLGQEVLHVN